MCQPLFFPPLTYLLILENSVQNPSFGSPSIETPGQARSPSMCSILWVALAFLVKLDNGLDHVKVYMPWKLESLLAKDHAVVFMVNRVSLAHRG